MDPARPDTSPTEAAAATFEEPRRLHPASILLGVNPRVLIQNYLVPAFAGAIATGFALSALVIIGLIGLVVRVLAWQRFSYAFDGEVLRVDEGVLSRNRRALDVERIQQVEVERGAVQRIFGLATLRVETASGAAGGAAELRVVTEREATRLRTALRAVQEEVGSRPDIDGEGREEVPTREIIRVPLRHVVLGAVTGARLLVFPAVIAGAFQFTGPRTQEWVETLAEEAIAWGLLEGEGAEVEVTVTTVLTIVAVALVASVITAAAVGVLRDSRFRIEERGRDLHVTRGLLSTRSSVLPLRRVQLVAVQRNWLRRLLRFAVVRVSSAGGGGERRITVPLLPDDDIDALLPELYPGATGTPVLRGHPRPAMRRAIFRWVRKLTVVIAAVWILPWAWLEPLEVPSLGLLVIAVGLGVVEYRQLAHGTDDQLVAARQGALSVTTSLAPLTKVQTVTTASNPFQRRLGLATVTAHVAGPGGDVEALDAGADDAAELHRRLTEHAADPRSTGLDLGTVAPETAAESAVQRSR